MKALSLSQPWLWAILHAGKRVENRSWPPPRASLPLRIALHAAKSWDADAIGFFGRLGITGFPARQTDCARGALVGIATVVDSVSHDDDLQADQRRWFFGPYGWLLEHVRPLKQPIPIKGALGLWRVPDDITAAIAAQLGEELR